MRGRDYNKQIRVFEGGSNPDGFGGNIVYYSEVFSIWAKLVNSSSTINQKRTELGITDFSDILIFKIRYRPNISGRKLFFDYNNKGYVIQSIKDVDIMHRELEIICTRVRDEAFDFI